MLKCIKVCCISVKKDFNDVNDIFINERILFKEINNANTFNDDSLP